MQYSDETATTLARQLLDGATDESRIAVVSAPSAFVQLKNLLVCGFGYNSCARLGLANVFVEFWGILLQA